MFAGLFIRLFPSVNLRFRNGDYLLCELLEFPKWRFVIYLRGAIHIKSSFHPHQSALKFDAES
jgi:hypothetical protein